jgi:hypothetical protein
MKRLFAATMSISVVVALLGVTPVLAQDAGVNTPRRVEVQISDIEEQFRVAKLRNDVRSLDRILDRSFVETNQNGNSRTKTQTIELFRSFLMQSLTTDSSTVRVAGNAALVTGSQTEVNGTGTDRMLFTRVYVKSGDQWRLLASSQFRNPKLTSVASR